MLLVSTIMTVVVKLAFISVKHTSDTYLQQRARLFMHSVIENSILAIEGYDRISNNNCLKEINFSDENQQFLAKVKILRYYCYDENDCPCDSNKTIQTPFSHGYVLMDVVVETNISNVKNNGKKIKLEKIMLQRP